MNTVLNDSAPGLLACVGGVLVRFAKDEAGATAIEYGLLCALMAMACITAFTAVGGANGGAWGGTANKVANAGK